MSLILYYQHTCLRITTFLNIKKIANCALRDTIHRIYQGILYFQSAMRFHCIQVNIISFTNTRKVLSSMFSYSRINKYLSDFHADLLHGITLKIERTSGNVGRSFCMLFCKVRGTLHRYSHNSQTFNKSFEYLCTEYFPNFNETVHTRKNSFTF
jgi:IS1 family transposase